MKNFKEWVSYKLLSKSLLSARPFSFFYEESTDGEHGNQGISLFLHMLCWVTESDFLFDQILVFIISFKKEFFLIEPARFALCF